MRSVPVWLAVLLWSTPCLARFEDTEVSALGSEPVLVTDGGWRWEDLNAEVPGVSYDVHRLQPGDGFRCIASNLDENLWAGDPAEPTAGEPWWYQVSADDGWRENRIGGAQRDLPAHRGSGLPLGPGLSPPALSDYPGTARCGIISPCACSPPPFSSR